MVSIRKLLTQSVSFYSLNNNKQPSFFAHYWKLMNVNPKPVLGGCGGFADAATGDVFVCVSEDPDFCWHTAVVEKAYNITHLPYTTSWLMIAIKQEIADGKLLFLYRL